MPVHFSTDDLPPRDREQYWLDVFATQVMRVTPGDRLDLTTFRAEVDIHAVARFTLYDFETSHASGRRTAADLSRDNSDRFCLMQSYRARLYTAAPTRATAAEVRLAPGDFCISSCEWPYEWKTQGGTSAGGLLIPHRVLSPLLAGGRLTGPVPVPAGSPIGSLLGAAFEAAATQLPLLSPDLGDAVLQNLCGLVALACGASEEGRWSARDSLRAARLESAKRHIEQHLAEPGLTPSSTAAALGISVRHLHLLFEPTGASFAQHVARRRLLQCRAALASPAGTGRSVADIAFGWGFNSLATFYRAFLREFGVPPAALRAVGASASRQLIQYPARFSPVCTQ
jgi:AraC-like DNA-binding protein